MAFLGQTYTTEDLPQGNGSFEPIPAGNYDAEISEADVVPTRNGSGQYIKLKLTILGPTHQGRVVFSNINIRNASSQAEAIGLQQLGDIARAVGLASVSDSDQLVGKNLQIKVSIRPAKDGYEAQNEVKGYKAAANAGGTFASTFKSPPPPPEASTGGSAPPWKKSTILNDEIPF